MLKMLSASLALLFLGSCGENRADEPCSINSPADQQRILATKLTDASLRLAMNIGKAQEDAGVWPIPAYPLCWGLQTIADQASGHRPTRDALARAGVTPVEYAAILLNLEGYRHPQLLELPDRSRRTATMLANEQAVARFDRALAEESRAEDANAKPQ